MADTQDPAGTRPGMLAVLLVGTSVAVVLGVWGSAQDVPRALPSWWFSSTQSLKAWLSTLILMLIVGQVLSGSWMYRFLPGAGQPRAWVAPLHRWSGRAAFLISLPVLFYCLYTSGFDTSTARTFAHSLAGCTFYGIFAAKMTGLQLRRVPSWLVPILGGLLFTAFVVAWSTSSLWWFRLAGLGL